MADSIDVQLDGNLLTVKATGKLTKEFYEQLVPVVDEQIKEHGKIRVLFEAHDFHGWTAGALWEDVKFDWAHWSDIEKLAIVGESKWEQGMAVFCKPFTKAKIKYFDHTKRAEALLWLKE